MAVTKKQTAEKNISPAKKGGKGSEKQATSGKALVKKDSKKSLQAKKRPGKLSAARSYLSGVLNELKKVHWPSRRETAIYTAVVLVAVGIVGVLIWVFDLLLSRVVQLIY